MFTFKKKFKKMKKYLDNVLWKC